MPEISLENPRGLLTEALHVVDTLNEDQVQLQQYQDNKKQLDKSFESLTRGIEKEKNDTLKTRRADIEDSFDKQLKNVDSEISAINSRRQKARAEGVKTRVADNTAAPQQQIESLKKAMREYVKEQKAPGILRSRAYYTLFSPLTAGDWILDILLVAIMVGVVVLAFIRKVSLPVFLIVVVAILALIAVYAAVSGSTKGKHHDAVVTCRQFMKQIRQQEKVIRAISRNIQKDKDDSVYDLADFDRELNAASQKRVQIETQKTEALYQFDNVTKGELIREIDQKFAGRLGDLNASIAQNNDAIGIYTKRVEDAQSSLSNNYVQYVGSRNLTHEKLEKMIEMIDAGEAGNLSDAVSRINNER